VKLSVLSIAVLLLGVPVLAVADDLDNSFQALKDAEAKSDAALVKKLGAEVCALARKAAAEPAPQEADEKEGWKSRIAYAHDVETYSEYALYSVAIKSQPATTVELIATLEEQNPKSKYLDEGYASYLYALSQTGATAKIPAIAEKALANFPENEDLLLFLSDHAYSAKQPDKALNYANRLVASISKHSKPEGVAQADWDRKKNLALGTGYWVAGIVSGEKGQHAAANKNLRAALPYVKGNDIRTGAALFYLGVSNYNLGKMTNNKAQILEGARFSDECAKIPGPFVDQAYRNSMAMKAEAGRMR
jgi:hypothetical protein